MKILITLNATMRDPLNYEAINLAKAELGTKRVCPETGRKFYDLNRDPIVSPYSGQSYPLSFFEEPEEEAVAEEEKTESTKADATDAADAGLPELDDDGVEIVSLEDADDETAGVKDIPELEDDDDDSIGDPSDDAFLETDDDDNDDVSDLIIVSDEGDEN